MNQYADYCLEDFVLDARFQNWVRYKQPDEVTFWQTFTQANPIKPLISTMPKHSYKVCIGVMKRI